MIQNTTFAAATAAARRAGALFLTEGAITGARAAVLDGGLRRAVRGIA